MITLALAGTGLRCDGVMPPRPDDFVVSSAITSEPNDSLAGTTGSNAHSQDESRARRCTSVERKHTSPLSFRGFRGLLAVPPSPNPATISSMGIVAATI